MNNRRRPEITPEVPTVRHPGDVSDSDYRQWSEDGEVLARIGRALFDQQLRVRVTIPAVLADEAVAAWERDSSGATLPKETAEQHATRIRGATLGLIGLTVQTTGVREDDQVVTDLDAWHIGGALDAAEEDGLLDGVLPSSP